MPSTGALACKCPHTNHRTHPAQYQTQANRCTPLRARRSKCIQALKICRRRRPIAVRGANPRRGFCCVMFDTAHTLVTCGNTYVSAVHFLVTKVQCNQILKSQLCYVRQHRRHSYRSLLQVQTSPTSTTATNSTVQYRVGG